LSSHFALTNCTEVLLHDQARSTGVERQQRSFLQMKCLALSEVKKQWLLAMHGCHRRQAQGAADNTYQEA